MSKPGSSSVGFVSIGAIYVLWRTECQLAAASSRGPSCPPGRTGARAATAPADPVAEHLDLDRRAGLGAVGGDVGVRDRALDGVAVAAARHAADDLAVDPHGLRAEGDGARVVEDEAGEATLGLLPLEQRLAADELALVELDREPEPGLVGRVLGRDVGAPDAVALLEAAGVDRPVAAGDEAVPAAGVPDRVPQPQPELHRAVELPAELAHVGDAEREARAPARSRPRAPACTGRTGRRRPAGRGSRVRAGPQMPRQA